MTGKEATYGGCNGWRLEEMVIDGYLTVGDAVDIMMLERRLHQPWWWPAFTAIRLALFGPAPLPPEF